MSLESEILRIQHNIADAYAKVSEKGGNVPLQPNSANLAAAVASIPTDATILVNAPIGSILTWSGTEADVPTGWHICNGEDGTLDLRDKFVLGAGTNHVVGETGGSEEVTLTLNEIPRHSHSISLYNPDISQGLSHDIIYTGNYLSESVKFKVEANKNNYAVNISSAIGNSSPHPNMPPYYALLFIQKVSTTPTDYVTETEMNTAIQTAISNIPAGSNVPTGGIIIWSGVSTAVPSGWVLCDGTNGTPDLRGRFVLGESADHAHGATGGSEEVTLTVEQMPSHSHYIRHVGIEVRQATSDAQTLAYHNSYNPGVETSTNGSSQPHPNMPPYYVLAYIMKL